MGILSYLEAHSRQPAAYCHAAPLLKYTEASQTGEFAALYAFEIAKINIEIKKSLSLKPTGQFASENFSLEKPPLFTAKFYFCGVPHASWDTH